MRSNTKAQPTRPAAGEFRGRVGGVEYTDKGLFESAARALGYRPGYAERRGTWRVGTEVGVTMADGTFVRGQVWSMANVKNYVWVALENGKYVAVNITYGNVYDRPSSSTTLGKVA